MRPRRYAIGDPQAPLPQLLAILRHNDLLSNSGRLDDDVFVVSMGDHFDYGGPGNEEVSKNGLEILSWLASHPPDQVVLILGNHDMARVGELADFSDEEFARAQKLAKQAYRDGDTESDLEAQLIAEYPALPSAEVAARDYAGFSEAQRALVINLFHEHRWRLAYQTSDTLFSHAGITNEYLEYLDLRGDKTSSAIAARLNELLYDAFSRWDSGPLGIPGIHEPGHSARGEGGGMLYHRPANPVMPTGANQGRTRTMGRRYDPRSLPVGITQVVGHVSDAKCRQLLGSAWTDGRENSPGALRHMVVTESTVHYKQGLPTSPPPNAAVMIFADGGMNHVAPEAYELYELPQAT